jgi:SAM-dependent methyltransferase
VDNVLFVAALHAIGDVRGAVAEATRVLRPGGRLVAAHGAPRREPDDDDIARAVAPLIRLQNRPDTPDALDEAAAITGLRPVGTAWVAPADLAHAPDEVADIVEQRLWSYLWSVDEPTWDRIVAPVIAALRTLPEPDRPRPHRVSTRLAVFEKMTS